MRKVGGRSRVQRGERCRHNEKLHQTIPFAVVAPDYIDEQKCKPDQLFNVAPLS